MSLKQEIAKELKSLYSRDYYRLDQKEYFFDSILKMQDDPGVQDEMRAYWAMLNRPPQEDWTHEKLQLDDKKRIMTNNPTNLFTILNEHPKFKGRLSFNEFSFQYYYDSKEIVDMDYTRLRTDICNELRLTFKKADVIDMADLVARNNPFNPIKDYLNNLKWDGKDRMLEFCSAMTIDVTELNITALRKWLIAAVARIMKPGCKVDSMPVLHGKTSARKSTVIKELLFSSEYFTDEPIDFGSKDSKQQLLGKWLVEIAEMSSFNKKENNLIKQNITQEVDEFRAPYDRKPKKYPRQFVYVGTTNDPEFLKDPTSNRRFWVFHINGQHIDTDTVRTMRDQLWAQAVSLYLSGEKWHLDPNQEQEMAAVASQYEEKDAWFDAVVSYLENMGEGNKNFFTTTELLSSIKPLTAHHDNMDKKRICNIMQFLKWENKLKKIDGKPVNGWHRPAVKIVNGHSLPQPTLDWS
jgi:putative DNA primase/helicase